MSKQTYFVADKFEHNYYLKESFLPQQKYTYLIGIYLYLVH